MRWADVNKGLRKRATNAHAQTQFWTCGLDPEHRINELHLNVETMFQLFTSYCLVCVRVIVNVRVQDHWLCTP